MAPQSNVLSPIGDELLIEGLKKQVTADFYAATSRSPAVYRGNPFLVEAALAYGGGQLARGELILPARFDPRGRAPYREHARAREQGGPHELGEIPRQRDAGVAVLRARRDAPGD